MIKLNSGYEMPALGFGTFLIKDSETFYLALKNGYTHFDTATCYSNEEFIGEAITKGIAEGLVQRENLFIATKLWHTDYSDPEAALKQSLQKLQMEYVDLYMIHWPYNGVGPIKVPMHVLWSKMEDLVKKGLVRSIGVSNFNIQLIADMLTYAEIKPAVNQIQIYPEMAQIELVKWLLEQNIQPVGYSPLGRLGVRNPDQKFESLTHPYVLNLATKYQKTPAQICLAWGLSRGYCVIPKAASDQNQKANLEALSFKLTDDEVSEVIKVLDCHAYIIKALPNSGVDNIFA